MNRTSSKPVANPLLYPGGALVPREHVARIWQELALGQWRVLAAADAGGMRLVAIAPVQKEAIRWGALTPRESAVLALAARGTSQKVVAAELGMRRSNVSEALGTARTRLGFASVSELLRAYAAREAVRCSEK
jgi:DNA-binding NarL/FixJ family response regulator